MADKPWKAAERRLAALFGTRRRPLSGGNQGQGFRDDAIHDDLHLECKYSRTHALWTLFRETRKKAQKERRTPVIGLVEKGSPGILLVVHTDDLESTLRALIEAKSNGKLHQDEAE